METQYLIIGGVVLGVAGVIYYLNKSGAVAAQGAAPGLSPQVMSPQALPQAPGSPVMAPTMTTPASFTFLPGMNPYQQNPQRPLPGMPGFHSPGLPPPGYPPGLPHSFPSTNLNQRTSAPTTPSVTPGTQPRAPSPNLASNKGGRFSLRNTPAPASEPMVVPPGPGNSPSIPAVIPWPGTKTYSL
jgi:hypothetical protein